MGTNYMDYYERDEDANIIAIDNTFNRISNQTKSMESSIAFWAVVDGILLVFIICGNILTILAVRFSRRLRSVISNMFVLSLAISDMVVGFTLPYHLAFYIGSELGQYQGWCLLRFFLIIFACSVSIWNLIAIAVDRYIAVVYPLHYSRYITKKIALILLSSGWFLGAIIALIPMFWNNWKTAKECEFVEILPRWYMAGVITPGFGMIWICMLIVYWRIWREASKHAKQLRSSFTGLHETPSDWKSIQVVLFILGCFSICWLPYIIVACAQLFNIVEYSSPFWYKAVFYLAMANSGMNPIIYAWKNASFRQAFTQLLRCKSPDYIDFSQYSTRSNNQRKCSTIQHQDTIKSSLPGSPQPKVIVSEDFDICYENNLLVDTNDIEKYKISSSLIYGNGRPVLIAHSTSSPADITTVLIDDKLKDNLLDTEKNITGNLNRYYQNKNLDTLRLDLKNFNDIDSINILNRFENINERNKRIYGCGTIGIVEGYKIKAQTVLDVCIPKGALLVSSLTNLNSQMV